ncbi:peptidylprolyl isomerase [Paenalcaligenes niemegkensis]|uniref:peptidylprolyl isomerase n=1 Tax=Paenalcaligenes niemegkensis TaxID=2895469 RepID=UPI001EE867BE|nr:peptidylprolyl isomerase [Paenalcaligenes niemegkensis]MCQ9616912.1 peptidylprolyl isomerase [Paenalcaligenes niemegkensis]
MKRFAALALTCALAVPVYAQNIATVNGKAITEKQLDEFVALLIEQGANDSPQLREQVKQELIGRQVVVQAAEKAGLEKRADVKQEIELARQGILVRTLMSDYLKKNPVSDADVTAEYETLKKQEAGKQEYKVRHVLVEDEQEAKKLLADIKAKKVTFDEAAKKHSIDTGSGQRGGDLGWASSDNYVPSFSQAVQALKKGELSPNPVESEFGWHIIQVDDSRALQFPELSEVKPQIEDMMRQTKLNEYQESLFKAADIK